VIAYDGITLQEAQWLSQYALELAAIRPEQVLKRLFRALSQRFDPHELEAAAAVAIADGGGVAVELDTISFSTDAGDGDGGGDAFG
jgi:hypothetical protein